MELNWIAIIVAALVTLLVEMLWYSDAGFGKIWMKEAGLHPEDMKKGNMIRIFGLTILYSLMVSIMVSSIVVHQFSAYGMIGGTYDPSITKPSFMAFMNDYGTNFRIFGHGALHGFIT